MSHFQFSSCGKKFLVIAALIVQHHRGFAQERSGQFQELASFRVLSTQEQEEALDFVLNATMEVSFETYGLGTLEDMAPVQEVRETFLRSSLTHYEVVFTLNTMLSRLFQDAHTRIEVDDDAAGNEYKFLSDMCLQWLFSIPEDSDKGSPNASGIQSEFRLVNTCDSSFSKKGDVVVSMGGRDSSELLDILQETIPHENLYFLTGLPSSWLVREDFLAHFGVLGDSEEVPFIFERDGVLMPEVRVPLKFTAASREEIPFVRYEIRDLQATAIFTLDECTFNAEYTETLADFWLQVKENTIIDTVILDLRRNRGGAFAVAPAFLDQIAHQYNFLFRVEQRQSDELCVQDPTFCDPALVGFLQQMGVNTTDDVYSIPSQVLQLLLTQLTGPPPPIDQRFHGQLYVLTSGTTFSSAHLFAGTVQGNEGLGQVVGTPTGNSRSFHGNDLSFAVPHLQNATLYLTTARNLWVEEGMSMYPDIIVPTTIADVVEGRDAQLEWVLATRTTAGPNSSPSSGMPQPSHEVGFFLLALSSVLFL